MCHNLLLKTGLKVFKGFFFLHHPKKMLKWLVLATLSPFDFIAMHVCGNKLHFPQMNMDCWATHI